MIFRCFIYKYLFWTKSIYTYLYTQLVTQAHNMSTTNRLSEASLKALKWEGKDRRITDGQGLYLFVLRSSKTWIIRRRHGWKNRITTIGKWPVHIVKEVRPKADHIATSDDP
ncbi:Arm DNA-binding domain-containing protein [Solemya velum gill symbiont]|uniref:Integrase DNA-binding domain-containing protein n=2 Tax=Solemya velum gill symbiont TaxID=2340 RepID=A0A0B0HDQ7_SOVGS|nr:hypothetical protein JV46_21180 [Solemya velum gill symbiont]OOY49661.1 hypothetical protein BOV97_12595 [Solemya velum gill symbiont]OOY51264.1 hypothetical protein BOV94_05825 [Solemya velum gill symbiont]OOY63422.1 hypothetical protein BOW05_12750 [Solemya velum gill symbiont]OOY75017.1 hypothetical protein BOW10_11935 [Solemya velum gill symbiont]